MNNESTLERQDANLIESAIQLCRYLLAYSACTKEQRLLIVKAIDFISRSPSPLNYDGNIEIIAQLFPDGTSNLANLKRWWRITVADQWLHISLWYDDPALDQDEEDEFEFEWALQAGKSEIVSDTASALWLDQINNFGKLMVSGYELTVEANERFFK